MSSLRSSTTTRSTSFFEAMRALKRQGLVVAFVSHHLAEVGAVADALTILKDGLKVGDFEDERAQP